MLMMSWFDERRDFNRGIGGREKAIGPGSTPICANSAMRPATRDPRFADIQTPPPSSPLQGAEEMVEMCINYLI
jgi:hypothetical protein